MLDLDHIAVIITAAGRGTRMGGAPKQWRDLEGRSVLARSIDAFAGFGRIVVTVSPEDMAHAIAALSGPVTLVAGGDSRSDSVRAGLEALEGSGVTHVLIHDGAHSLVPGHVITGVVAPRPWPLRPPCPSRTRCGGARVAASRACNRAGLFRAQTPQGSGWTPFWPRIGPFPRARRTMWNSPAAPGMRWSSPKARKTI